MTMVRTETALLDPAPAASAPAELTVVIVNYRTAELVIDCVRKLRRSPPSLAAMRIAVVDNGSGDGSLERLLAALPDETVIDAGGNLGFAKGNNLVLRGCDSDYALLLNSDAAISGASLDLMIAALRDNPRVGAVGGRIVDMDGGADQDYPAHFPTLGQMLRRMVLGPQFPALGRTTPVEMTRLHGACMMVRRDVLAEVGLLDEDFFMYDEDVDWCLRIRAAGWRLWLLPDALVPHLGGASSGRRPNGARAAARPSDTALRMRYELRRSRYRLYRKHRSTAEVLLLKLLTDAALLAGSLALVAKAAVRPAVRPLVLPTVRCNLRIMALNPFTAMER